MTAVRSHSRFRSLAYVLPVAATLLVTRVAPPINRATAASGTPYFTANPGDSYKAWDRQVAADFMPQEFITFRAEYNHRAANVPYFTGPGGVTPDGGNQGAPGSMVTGWSPDLVKSEDRLTFAMMVKY